MAANQRTVNGEIQYFDGHCWMSERDTCQHCREERKIAGKTFQYAEEEYSMGIYAGRYCDPCWKKSGYRDANAQFDPFYAGEAYAEEDY